MNTKASCNMPASPPHSSVVGFGLDLLQTVKHSPLARTVTNNEDGADPLAADPLDSPVTNNDDTWPAPEVTDSQIFLLQEILQKPVYSQPAGENIEKLLVADLVESPVSFSASFDSTPSASESVEETAAMLSGEEEAGNENVPLPTNINHYQFYYPPQPSYHGQGYWQHPVVSLPAIGNESIVSHEQAKTAVAETNTLATSSSEVGSKRTREEAAAPIPEKAFAVNPLSPPSFDDFVTSEAATEATTSHGFSIAPPPASTSHQQQCSFAGLELLSNVSSASSEAANTNTFSYPTLGSLSKPSETKPKIEGCRCQQSKCLKLYCACFRDGKICLDSCKCVSCANTEAESGTEGRVVVARRELLKKKPNAFGDKSCRCSKTRCLKFYCVCFASGNPCGDSCKCEECKNPKGVRSLPNRPNNTEVAVETLDATI
jgi:hypothetical protein